MQASSSSRPAAPNANEWSAQVAASAPAQKAGAKFNEIGKARVVPSAARVVPAAAHSTAAPAAGKGNSWLRNQTFDKLDTNHDGAVERHLAFVHKMQPCLAGVIDRAEYLRAKQRAIPNSRREMSAPKPTVSARYDQQRGRDRNHQSTKDELRQIIGKLHKIS